MKHIYSLGQMKGRLVLFALFIVNFISYSQEIVIPTHGDNLELKSKTSIHIEGIPELSFNDTPAIWSIDYTISCATAGECTRKSKRFFKKDRMIDGLGYAAETFNKNPKKRIKSKALKLITQRRYEGALAEYEKHMLDFPRVNEYVNYKSTKNTYYRMWFKNQFHVVNSSLEHHNDLFHLSLQPLDPNEFMELATELANYRFNSAEEYYSGALYWKNHGKNKHDYKKSALFFKISNFYKNRHKDATAQYQEMRLRATSSVNITSYYKGYGRRYGELLNKDVQSAIMNFPKWNRLEFVEFSNNKRSDYLVKLMINSLSVVPIPKISDKRDFSKEVTDENDNTSTKTASITTYSSGLVSSAKVNIEIIERATNKIIYSGISKNTFHFKTVWQTGKGDVEAAVPKKHREFLNRPPEKAPKYTVLLEKAISSNVRTIAISIYNELLLTLGSIPKDH